MKIYFTAFGCKVNSSENEFFLSELRKKGVLPAEKPEEADVIAVNTCAVTERASNKCRIYVEKLRREFPSAEIVVTGCLATESPQLMKASGASSVIVNGSKDSLTDHILSMTDGEENPLSAPFFGGAPSAGSFRTRAFFKIQDGCDAFCAYCVIPFLRGAPRSKPLKETVKEFKETVASGFKEIVLVGIHIGLYGREEGVGITNLLRELAALDGDFRIRLSSLETNEIEDGLLKLMGESPKICNHLHIPLQSGSDKILKSMGRGYSAADYINACRKAKDAIKDIAIGSDVIVGFPGEKSEDFEKTADTLLASGADFFHVFPYSDRKGTAASVMKGKVSREEKESRALVLRKAGALALEKRMAASLGKTYRVLTEKGNKGHTSNYLQIYSEAPLPPNIFINMEAAYIKNGRLYGKIKP